MKTNLHPDYLAPSTQVIHIKLLGSMMVTSTFGNASSESFQDESEYQSIW
ncbi:MAG: hypothetical protein J6W82_05545 [Bacteroidales bacterium]|nr:hypothetical protein [Bacteroidales bacterium]